MKTKQNMAVFGSQFGDEGKGRTVEYLCTLVENPLVIRFNGGAQAGHTVWLNENTKHVFHTYGSGTFKGANTYLGKHVLFDPFGANKERFELETLGFMPALVIDRKCRLVTIFDIFFNHLKETLNGHGSCGMGINETIDRNEVIPFVWDNVIKYVTRDDSLVEVMIAIQHYYLEKIDTLCGYLNIPDSLKPFADSIFKESFILFDGYAKNYLETCNIFKYAQQQHLRQYDQTLSLMFADHSLIFEGAQGLMLDEYHGNFPHVTRSRTGSPNVIDFCREFKTQINEVFYITRCYSTRHGKDVNYPTGNKAVNYFDIVDTTNIHNEWQGTIQNDYLNLQTLTSAINLDRRYRLANKCTIVITCLDQMKFNTIPTYWIGEKSKFNFESFTIQSIQDKLKKIVGKDTDFLLFSNKLNK